jgi:arabinogalactan oligomer/maltooligosaccharide transport system permease protein
MMRDRVGAGIACAFVVAVVGVAAVGLTRWQDAQRFRGEAERRIGDRVGSVARDLASGAARPTVEGTLHVIRGGRVDAFGALRDARIDALAVTDAALVPSDEAAFARDLMQRHAEFATFHARGKPIPRDRLVAAAEIPGDDALIGYAPILVDGTYDGLVRLAVRVAVPPPTVPTHALLVGIGVALVFGFALSRPKSRIVSGLLAAASIGLVFALAWSPWLADHMALPLGATLIAAALAALVGPGIARVVRGLCEQPTTYLYLLPAVIGMVVLVFIPFLMGVTLAFFSEGQFVGLSNFEEILSPPDTAPTTFYGTTAFTVLWTLANVALHVLIGVLLALVLNRPNLRLKGLYRVLLVVPWAVPSYITALIWKSMFNTQFGAINGLLDVLGVEPVKWLGPGSTVATNFLAALATNTWLGFPFMMVVTLGALQSIPKELYEAADIDGANRWQKFRMVTLPLLKPALIPAIILGVIWTFNMFNVIYLVTGGAPDNQTNILVTEAFYAFKVLDRFGLAAAYSLLIFVMLLLYGWMQNRVTRATEGAFE